MTQVPATLREGRVFDVALIAILGVGQALLMGIGAFATRDVFAALHGAGPTPTDSLVALAAAGCGVMALRWAGGVRAEALGQSYARDLRVALYRHMAGMTRADLSAKGLGALSLRFVGDLSAARGWVGLGLSRLCSATVVLPGAAIVLVLLDPRLALAATAPVLVSLILALAVAAHLNRAHRRLRSKRARIAIGAMERVALAPDLDLQGRTERELRKMSADGDQLKSDAVARVARASGVRALPQVGAALGGAAVLWTAATKGVPAADAAGALAMLAILAMPLTELAGVWDRYCAWRVARAKCENLFAKPSRLRVVARRDGPAPIRFEGVSFRGVAADFTIPAGAFVLVTGAAGAGKSSLLSLVAAQDRPDRGRVSYGAAGATPRIAHIADAADLIVDGTLKRSMTLGLDPRPRDRAVEKAARRYGLGGVLERIGGVRGRVAGQGRTLSSGEALRVGLVRASLSKPDVVAIDHAAFLADPARRALLDRLRRDVDATILVADATTRDVDAAGELRLADGRAVYVPLNATESSASAAANERRAA